MSFLHVKHFIVGAASSLHPSRSWDFLLAVGQIRDTVKICNGCVFLRRAVSPTSIQPRTELRSFSGATAPWVIKRSKTLRPVRATKLKHWGYNSAALTGRKIVIDIVTPGCCPGLYLVALAGRSSCSVPAATSISSILLFAWYGGGAVPPKGAARMQHLL